jgi:hypothetical protein
MPFSSLSVKHLFPTPLVKASLPADVTQDTNRQLAEIILKKSKEMPEKDIAGRNWQSDDQIMEWGGEPVQSIVTDLTHLLAQLTFHMEGASVRRTFTAWNIKGNALIVRPGSRDYGMRQKPGGYWSVIYCVAGDMREDPVGGDLEFVDPRGIMPIQAAPELRFAIQDYLSAGMSEYLRLKPGECAVFPSWLGHMIRPYIGDQTQMFLLFHFSY